MGGLDVIVEGVEGLPAHTYISVRYGDHRRQAPFRPGEVLSFPVGAPVDTLPKAYTVDVFRKVGSKQVSLAGITAMGGSMKHEGLTIPSLEIQGSPVTVSLSSSFAEAKPVTPASRKREVATKARQYLEKHDVQSVLHDMFAQMLERTPGDPLAFMIDFLEQKREEAEERMPRCFADEPGLGDGPLPGFASGGTEEDLPDLTRHHSIAADVLRRDQSIYNSLRLQQTSLGVTLAQCIKPGIDCPGHELVKVAGAYAGDAESYSLFAGFLDPVIAALHGGWACGRAPLDRNPAKITNAQIDPTGKYAVFATMETRRNLEGIRFPTCCSKEERREVERVLGVALRAAERGVLKGAYLPLRSSQSCQAKPGGMSAHQEERLRAVGMLFAEPDSRMKLSAGLGRHWPDARGVFLSETQGLCLWCNEEDHLRFFARQDRADLRGLWMHLDKALDSVEESAKSEGHSFSCNKRLGYLTTCPSRLGSALRISVSMRIPLLSAAVDVPGLCRSLELTCSQVESNATHGESLWNVLSGDCLGVSEVDLINGTIEGCRLLVSLEQRLERGEAIYDSMPGLGDEAFPGFPADRCPARMPELAGNGSLMAAVLLEDPAVYAKLRTRKTNKGVTLAPCVKPGMDEVTCSSATACAGMVAGDESCYAMFRELFDPVLRRLHSATAEVFSEAGSLQPTDVRLSKLPDVDLGPVLAVRVELRRNLTGIRFSPCCTAVERQEVERLLVKGMIGLKGSFTGDYLPLPYSQTYAPKPGGVSWAEQAQLCEKGLLFSEPSAPSRLSAGLGRDWPEARGTFLTEAQDLWVFCNEEDHLRIISRQEGRNLKGALSRALDCVQQLEAELRRDGTGYVRDGRLGYLTVDPAHLGSALRCTVTMRLQRLAARPDFFALCSALGLQAAWRGGAWDLASGPSLGLSEVEVATAAVEACARLSALERQLERGSGVEEEVAAALGARAG